MFYDISKRFTGGLGRTPDRQLIRQSWTAFNVLVQFDKDHAMHTARHFVLNQQSSKIVYWPPVLFYDNDDGTDPFSVVMK